jgi:hypothetical protein
VSESVQFLLLVAAETTLFLSLAGLALAAATVFGCILRGPRS